MTNDDSSFEAALQQSTSGKLYIPETLLPPEEWGDSEEALDELLEALGFEGHGPRTAPDEASTYVRKASDWKGKTGGSAITIPVESASYVATSEDAEALEAAGFEVTECTGGLHCRGPVHIDGCFSEDWNVTACDRLGCDHSKDERRGKYEPDSPDSKEQQKLEGRVIWLIQDTLWEARERRHKSIDPAHPWLIKEEACLILMALRGAGLEFAEATPKEGNS